MNMDNMFFGCDSLKSLPDLSELNIPLAFNKDVSFYEFDSSTYYFPE